MKYIFLLLIIFVFPTIAQAYVGPGLGGGVLIGIIGVLLALVLLIIGVVWYPLKRFMAKIKGQKVDKE